MAAAPITTIITKQAAYKQLSLLEDAAMERMPFMPTDLNEAVRIAVRMAVRSAEIHVALDHEAQSIRYDNVPDAIQIDDCVNPEPFTEMVYAIYPELYKKLRSNGHDGASARELTEKLLLLTVAGTFHDLREATPVDPDLVGDTAPC